MLRVATGRIDDEAAASREAAPAWLGASERGRWLALKPGARAAFVASRRLLRQLLQLATSVDAARWSVSAEAGAAPLASAPHVDGAPQVSLSHRLGWVAAAIADARVGVDIECDRPARSDPAERAALMLAASEMDDWHALPPARREPALLDRWTAKEAWFKASAPGTAPWDFRRVVARACEPALANVRVWASPPLHVAVCCMSATDLASADCDGLDPAVTTSSYWHVAHAAPAA